LDATRHLALDFGPDFHPPISTFHLHFPPLSKMPDVEMKPADDKKADEKKEETKEEDKPKPISPAAEIKNNAAHIDRAVSTLEPRFTHRVLRTMTALRKKVDDSVLRTAIDAVYPKGALIHFWTYSSCLMGRNTYADSLVKKALLFWLPSAPAGGDAPMEVDSSAPKPAPSELVPEVEMYIRLLILHHLLTSEDTHEKALDLANESVEKMQLLNRRSMDAIASKIWYAVDRAYELGGELSDARP